MPNLPVRAAGEAVPAATRITFNFHPDDMLDIYGMIIEGDCLPPYIKPGTTFVFSRTEPYHPGDLVLLYKRPEILAPGEHQAVLMRLVTSPPSWARFGMDMPRGGDAVPVVAVQQFNPPRQSAYRVSDLLAIHKCLGPLPDDVETYFVTDDEVDPIARRGQVIKGGKA